MSKSYTCHYASSRRSSRVDVPRHTLGDLRKVAALARPARWVLLTPDARHVVVEGAETFDVLTRDGRPAFEPRRKIEKESVLAGDDEYVVSGWVHHWDASLDTDGKVSFSTGMDPGATLLAARHDEPRWISAARVPRARARPRPQVVLFAEARFPPPRKTTKLVWGETIDGDGSAAIDDARRPFVAMSDGRFVVYAPDGKAGSTKGVREVDVPLAFAPYEVSLCGPWAVVLAEGPGGGTMVVALERDGREAWRTVVPFGVEQPAIDAGPGWVVVVGRGVAAIAQGRVEWALPSPSPVTATSFEDGIALVSGRTLRIVGRDGHAHQSLTAPESLATPPAIAHDGAVWVGGAEGLYVAS